MSRSLMVACSLVLACISFAQDWTQAGSITSRQYQNQIREGNTIVATDFFTLEYSVETWIEDTGLRAGPHMTCDNKCKGLVHADHSKCDFSCDVKCTERHSVTVRGVYTPDRAAMSGATRDANALATNAGGTTAPDDWSHEVSQALAEFRADARKQKTFTMAHAGPCSGMDQWVGTKHFVFHVRGTMKKVGYRMSRGVRTPIEETVGTHESAVASADIVQDEPFETHPWTLCRCKGKEKPVDVATFKPIYDMFVGPSYPPEIKESVQVTPGAIIMENKAGEAVDPGESKITVIPKDLNTCTLRVENATGQDVKVTVPIGTVFDSQDPNDQDMTSLVRTQGWVLAGGIRRIEVNIRPQQSLTTMDYPIRWACLQMTKHEPNPAAKYVLRPAQDDVLMRLGAITNGERIRGPHDQARIWIYSDMASLDTINKRMFPTVSEGRYLSLLFEVGTIGGVDLAAPEYRKCLDPKILSGVPVDDQMTNYVVGLMAQVAPKDLAKFVGGNIALFARAMDGDPEFGPRHVAALATTMLDSENVDVRKAGLKLVAGIPGANREAFVAAGGLTGLRSVLASKNASDVSTAVDVLVAYPKTMTSDLLGAFWEQLPTEALRAKAKKSLGIE